VSAVKEQNEDPKCKKSEENTTNETKTDRQIDAPAPKELKKLELKSLPANLRYEFLNPEVTTPVIINVSLDEK
jgi:hypothetical protein